MVEEISRNFDRTVEVVWLVRFLSGGSPRKSHHVISLRACFPTYMVHMEAEVSTKIAPAYFVSMPTTLWLITLLPTIPYSSCVTSCFSYVTPLPPISYTFLMYISLSTSIRVQLLSIRSSQSIELHSTPVLRNMKLLMEAKHHSILIYKLIVWSRGVQREVSSIYPF